MSARPRRAAVREVGVGRVAPSVEVTRVEVLSDPIDDHLAEQVDQVDEPVVDHGLGVRAAGLEVRLQGDVELVALKVTAASDVLGRIGEHARPHRAEDPRTASSRSSYSRHFVRDPCPAVNTPLPAS